MTQRKVAIVTDSTADLAPQLVKARGITVVPLTLHFEGRSLLDGVDIVVRAAGGAAQRRRATARPGAATGWYGGHDHG